MKKCYQYKNFRDETLHLIDKCNEILERYDEAGYDMTLRQLYYQLVSADEIPNNQKEYNRLGTIVNDARLAGLIDWDYIVDRTRGVRSLAHWDTPVDILEGAAAQFRIDKWDTQDYRPEVWIEKDALAGVFERVCNQLDVPLFSCRGYTSQSEMYSAARRFHRHKQDKKIPVVLHFGDHDPSGIDMSRDIKDRLWMFGVEFMDFDRLALNMPQVQKYKPPPNPAKVTDSRAVGYINKFGRESWELDALPPEVLAALVRNAIKDLTDEAKWAVAVAVEGRHKTALDMISKHYETIQEFAIGLDEED